MGLSVSTYGIVCKYIYGIVCKYICDTQQVYHCICGSHVKCVSTYEIHVKCIDGLYVGICGTHVKCIHCMQQM
jgi:hypothetical protein